MVTLIVIHKSQMNKSEEEKVTVNKGTEKAGKKKNKLYLEVRHEGAPLGASSIPGLVL